tara:strand:- start:140 stop:556 length:417 start_codon:yes stop_codon:yes gene_type:complete
MKNLSKFKVALKTRECLIQAIYQMFFDNKNIEEIVSQFKKEHNSSKVDFESFSSDLHSVKDNTDVIERTLAAIDINHKNIELIDKSILYFAVNEMLFGELEKLIVINESLRLSKKYSNPESYKFINASLDKYLKTTAC